MEQLRTVLGWIDTATRRVGNVLSFTCLTLIGFTLYDIIARQIGLYTMWSFDITWFHLGFLLMMGLAYALLTGQFVNIDLLTSKYSSWTQHLLLFISFAVIGIPITILFAWLSWDWAMQSWAMKELTNSAARIPVYPVKTFVFIGLVLSLPQLFALAIRHGYFLFKKVEL